MTELQLRTIRLGKTCEGGTFGFSIGRLPSMHLEKEKNTTKKTPAKLHPPSSSPQDLLEGETM